jgi:hypothetical protein
MKILWVIVNYNTPKEALDLVKSIPENIEVVVISNGTELVNGLPERVRQEIADNTGYFSYWKAIYSQYDWVIYSNSDLLLSSQNLYEILYEFEGDILAPAVITPSGNNLNPKELTPPSFYKLLFLKSMYRYNWSFRAYQYMGSLRQKANRDGADDMDHPPTIFAPHGAVFIIKPSENLIEYLTKWNNFMFGEELYVGFVAEKLNLKIQYSNKVLFEDIGSVSLSRESVNRRRKWYYESIRYILKEFYS